MASNSGSSLSCKKCKAKVVNGWKCIICGCYFHSSCGKLRNVKVVDDNLINCCEKSSDSASPDGDAAFFDAMDEISGPNRKINVNIFNYIVKQKDMIIHELRDKISLLNQHIELLSKQNLTVINTNPDKSQKYEKVMLKPDLSKTKESGVVQKVQAKSHLSEPQLKKNPEKKEITKKEVSSAIAQAETQLKMDGYINLAKDEASTSCKDGKWNEVVKTKRKRQVIIGSNKESASVVGVPSYAMLHVYRIRPQTTCDELTDLMRTHFPEIKCESLNSKYPDLYSSFKVTILANDFKKAMDSNLWPYGACISRFLSKRKTNTTVT